MLYVHFSDPLEIPMMILNIMNRLNTHIQFVLLAVIFVTLPVQSALSQENGLLSVGIKKVEITPSLKKGVEQSRKNTLNRIVDSMESQMIDALHGTRKFKVIARSDLEKILKEQDLQRSLSGEDDMNAFKLAGCKYVVVTTVDDFQDVKEQLKGENGEVLATKRTLTLSAVTKIYKTKTAELEESANLSLEKTWKKEHMSGVDREGEPSDKLIQKISTQMAEKVAYRVTDVIFPAKVIAITGDTLMINRGDGTNIESGQLWRVFKTGEKIVDPDTGQVLGKKEKPVGKVKVTEVRPKFARAKIVADKGIEKHHVLRLMKNQ